MIASQTSAEMSSSDSLLDTPVPDTPDVPLSPMPAFFTAKAQSTDQLNHGDAASGFDPDRRGRAQSLGNLDELDSFLGTGETPEKSRDTVDDDDDDSSSTSSSTSSSSSNSSSSSSSSSSSRDSDSSEKDAKSTSEVFVDAVDEDSDEQKPEAADSSTSACTAPVLTATLVDLNFPSSAAASREATPATEKARRSEAAVAAALGKIRRPKRVVHYLFCCQTTNHRLKCVVHYLFHHYQHLYLNQTTRSVESIESTIKNRMKQKKCTNRNACLLNE